MSTLADPLKVRFRVRPHPTGRAYRMLLWHWRQGHETPAATHKGRPITPDEVDWAKLPPAAVSGTSRTYADRAAAGRPNKTFALPAEVDQLITDLAARLDVSRSAVVARAVGELAAKIDGQKHRTDE